LLVPNDDLGSSPTDLHYQSGLSTVCACGSGLSAAQCCTLDREGALPPAAEPEPSVLEALYLSRGGDMDNAAALCIALLEQTPTLLPALHLLFLIRRDQGRKQAALALSRRLARLAPADPGMAVEFARMLVAGRRWPEADSQARRALRLAPRSPAAHETLSQVFRERKDFAAAEYHLRQAIEHGDGQMLGTRLELAQVLMQQGALAEARTVLDAVLAVRPRNLPALTQLAQLEAYYGDAPAAAALLDSALSEAPGAPVLLEAKARLAFDSGDFPQALAHLAGEAGSASAGSLLLKGRTLDRLGDTDAAFEAFEAAQQLGYDAAEAKAHLAWIENTTAHYRKFFTARLMQSLARAAPRQGGKQPIFVLGFARSGTTMVEQSLSMHAQVCGGGEIQSLRTVVNQAQRLLYSALPYPNALTEVWMGDCRNGLNRLRDVYLDHAAQHHAIAQSEKPFFTDKMIFNEMHLALIALILPEAPVIHMIRHPLDVVLSVFSHQLAGGVRSRFTLEDTARHYAAIMDLVAHYRAENAAGRYLPVRYEDVVADQKGQIAGILDFAGLKFDAACLRFQENPRYARTISFGQVRQSLNADGVFRYRRYRRQLAPIYPILAPCIERLGYAIE